MNIKATNNDSRECKPTSWQFNLIFIVGMSIVTGLMVYVLLNLVLGDDRVDSILTSILVAALFTTVFTFAFQLSGRLLERYYVSQSIYDLWIPVGISSLVMISAFIVTAWVYEQLFSGIKILDWGSPVFYSIGGVSLLACIIGNTIYYGRNFYLQYMEAERLRHESQMSALKSQINPHFLFNSLNSIASLVRVDPVKAERVIEDLSDLFRYSLQSSKKEEMTLKDELTSTEHYFAIEKARFGERIQYTVDVQDGLGQLPVPGLILQPLVENCVKHGANKTAGPFLIHVSAAREGNNLIIKVTDSGNGFNGADINEITRKGTGLSNIRDRLHLQYGSRASLKPDGNTVELEIPIKR